MIFDELLISITFFKIIQNSIKTDFDILDNFHRDTELDKS